ncbi:MAG: TonB-dependent siderophore receptor, partial [Gammaproteobacteria bacterium]
TDATRLLLQGTYQKDDFISHFGVPLQRDGEDFQAPDVRRSLFFGLPAPDNSRELLAGTAQLEQQLGDHWLATLRLNANSPKLTGDHNGYAYGLDAAGVAQIYSGTLLNVADIWSGEVRLNGNLNILDRPVNLTLGIERSEFDYTQRFTYGNFDEINIYDDSFNDVVFVPPPPSSAGGRSILFKTTGAYAQVQFRPFDRLSILLGGRYDRADATLTAAFGPGEENEKRDEKFTGRAGLTFDLTKQLSVYGLYAQSFNTDPFAIGLDGILDAETGEIFEAGLKTEWFDGRLGINAALFRLERDDVAILDPSNGPGVFFRVNAGLQRNDGFELEINGEPLPGWNLSFGGILLDAEFIERDDPNFGNAPRNAA